MEELTHSLIPKHTKLSDKEKDALFEKYGISVQDLPKISITDPAIEHMLLKPGDVIKIDRTSSTAGETVYYRGVISE